MMLATPLRGDQLADVVTVVIRITLVQWMIRAMSMRLIAASVVAMMMVALFPVSVFVPVVAFATMNVLRGTRINFCRRRTRRWCGVGVADMVWLLSTR
jgi:hypothetical protein